MATEGTTTDNSNGSHGSITALARTQASEVRVSRSAAIAFGAAWEYSPAPETTKVAIAPRYGHFINGRFVQPRDAVKRESKSAKTSKASTAKVSPYFTTTNPATEEELAEIALGSEADVDAAVHAAREAFPKWAGLKASERAKYLFRIARRIQERARELSILETMDGGKPIRESRDVDIPLAAQHFFYHAGWADKLAYAFPGMSMGTPSRREGRLPSSETRPSRREGVPNPVGVCGQIIPWNFPLLIAAWKLAPALCCGNTVVLKPAETTPLTSLKLAEICREADLPPGVVNIIPGAGE
ncbi:MAG: aldehyde dehydrogenase family protein, partial [Pyrinomonadaceae bacterium]|nr:aldehyde dehydrogenase family protein [Phycisphaerales bacterium]